MPGRGTSTPVIWDNQVFLLTVIPVVAKQGAKLLKALAPNRLDDGFDASPAPVGGDLFLRGRQNLYCLSESR